MANRWWAAFPRIPWEGAYRLVEVVPHRVGQRADGVVQDEQVLVLVLAEGEHQRVQDKAEVRHQLRARLLLQGGKRTEAREGGGVTLREDRRLKHIPDVREGSSTYDAAVVSGDGWSEQTATDRQKAIKTYRVQ